MAALVENMVTPSANLRFLPMANFLSTVFALLDAKRVTNSLSLSLSKTFLFSLDIF